MPNPEEAYLICISPLCKGIEQGVNPRAGFSPRVQRTV